MMHRISIVVWILLGIANGYTAIWTEYCPKFVDTPLANRALERGDEAVDPVEITTKTTASQLSLLLNVESPSKSQLVYKISTEGSA